MSGNCERCRKRDELIITQPTTGGGKALCAECYTKHLDSFTTPQPPQQDVDDERKYGKYW